MDELLKSFGLGISVNMLWDFLKLLPSLTREQFKEQLAEYLGIENANEKIDELILYLEKNGYLENDNNKLSIVLERINADGRVVGIEGKTSSSGMKDIMENKSVDIRMSDINAKGDVIGVHIDVDAPAEIKHHWNIQNESSSVQFNPGNGGRIILGGDVVS